MGLTDSEVQVGLQQLSDSGRLSGHSRCVSRVVLLGSGFETDVFVFSLDAQGGNAAEELVLRIYGGQGATEKAAREFDVMARLRTAGYPVPRVIALQGDGWPLGQPFLIMERIEGGSLWSALESGSPERRRELQRLHCRLMVQLHAMEPGDILPDAVGGRAAGPAAFLEGEIEALRELVGRLGGREPPSLRQALDWLEVRLEEVSCVGLSVIHGDFHPNNVLLRTDGAAFVIDWSNVRLADYRTDLAWTRLITRADTRSDRGVTELRTYECLAGREVPGIDYFEVMAGIRLLASTLVSLQFGAARQGMRPEAEALMRRDAEFMQGVAALLQERTQVPMSDLAEAIAELVGRGGVREQPPDVRPAGAT